MAQLWAQRDQVVVVGSLPERLISRMTFPSYLRVFLAECPTPRLTTQEGVKWLQSNCTHSKQVSEWASSVMDRFSAVVFTVAGALLIERLRLAKDADR